MKKKPTLKEIFTYYYNTILNKGTVFKVALLFVVSVLFIFLLSVCLNIASGGSISENGWATLLHLLDPGVLSGDDAPASYLAIMLVATLGGMVLFGTLIGIINEGITSRLSDINSFNYKIIEKDHIIIIGFNEETFYILKEFADYNAERKNAGHKPHSIVIVDDNHTVEEMSTAVESILGKHTGTRILFRVGNSLNPQVLDKCNAAQAKNIIINTQNDYLTLKWIINISNLLAVGDGPVVTTIVKELKNVLAVEYAGGEDIRILFPDDIINHILSMICNSKGILDVLDDFLDFRDVQIVYYEDDLFTDISLREINNTIKEATVIGLLELTGKISFDPADLDRRVSKGEGVLFLADNEYVIKNELKALNKAAFRYYENTVYEGLGKSEDLSQEPKTVLILRFSRTIEALVEEQFSLLPEGSKVYVACSDSYSKYLKLLQMGYEDQGLEILKLKGISYYSMETLLNRTDPDKVIILSDYMEPSASLGDDAETVFKDVDKEDEEVLLAALFLRDIAKRKELDIDIIAELQKTSSQALVSNMRTDCDYVNVGHITNHILTQAVNDQKVFDSLKALFSNMQYSLKFYDISLFLNADGVTAYDIRDLYVFFGSRKKMLIGIKRGSESIMNPSKKEKWVLSPGDKAIVIESK